MKHALIVEDDTFLAGIYAGKLERLGYAVRVASSVSEAVRKLEEARPDVLMLDIVLGAANGLQVLNYLRQMPQCSDVPVVVVSNQGEPETVQQARQSGVRAYLMKSYYTPSEIALQVHSAATPA